MNIPLYQRYDVEMKKKMENLRKLKNKLESEREKDNLENCTFKPKINKSKSNTRPFRERVEKSLKKYQFEEFQR